MNTNTNTDTDLFHFARGTRPGTSEIAPLIDAGALATLELALEEKTAVLPWINWHPMWNELRPHPRFQAILKRMNLVK